MVPSIESFVYEHHIDCLLLTETWLGPKDQEHGTTCDTSKVSTVLSVPKACFVPEGFTFLHVSRDAVMANGRVKSGGGVGCLVDDRFKSSFIPSPKFN